VGHYFLILIFSAVSGYFSNAWAGEAAYSYRVIADESIEEGGSLREVTELFLPQRKVIVKISNEKTVTAVFSEDTLKQVSDQGVTKIEVSKQLAQQLENLAKMRVQMVQAQQNLAKNRELDLALGGELLAMARRKIELEDFLINPTAAPSYGTLELLEESQKKEENQQKPCILQ
jgi:hypothetical protein